jgi:hypothetical protein
MKKIIEYWRDQTPADKTDWVVHTILISIAFGMLLTLNWDWWSL